MIMLSLRLDSNNSTAISSDRKGRHEVGQTKIKVRIADAFSFLTSLKQQALSKTAGGGSCPTEAIEFLSE